MPNRLGFDELNIIETQSVGSDASVKKRSVPFEQYFGEMQIPEEDKEKRILLAESLLLAIQQLFLFYVSYIVYLILGRQPDSNIS